MRRQDYDEAPLDAWHVATGTCVQSRVHIGLSLHRLDGINPCLLFNPPIQFKFLAPG